MMATFQTPQFIEKKAKIVGPLTLHQFLYFGGAAVVSFIAYHTLTFFLWVLVSIFFIGLAFVFAFVRINGQPLGRVLFAALGYAWRPRIYTWKRAMFYKKLDTESSRGSSSRREQVSVQKKLKSLATTLIAKGPRAFHIRGKQKKEQYRAVHRITGETEVAHKVDYPAGQ
jgi:hypothetical protein